MAREDGVRFMGYRGLVFDGRTLFVAVAGFVAALLVWGLLAAPALAQGADAQAGDAGAQAGDVDFQAVDCSQVQAAVAGQYNSGDAGAVAVQYGDATASIAQALNIDQSQVNGCLGGTGGAPTDDGTGGDVDSSADVLGDTISGKDLPNTGGVPLPAAVFGLALVAAGILSAGSIVRRGR
jgi:hypothetical protein